MPHDDGKPDDKIVRFRGAKVPLSDASMEIDNEIIHALGRHLEDALPDLDRYEIELCAEDILAIESEKAFKSRFGFALGRRGRIALFDLIDRYDLTGDEVKALYRVGALTWDGSTLRVKGKYWARFAGLYYLLILGIMTYGAATLILRLPQNAILHRFEALAMFTLFIALAVAVYRVFFKPFNFFRRRGGG